MLEQKCKVIKSLGSKTYNCCNVDKDLKIFELLKIKKTYKPHGCWTKTWQASNRCWNSTNVKQNCGNRWWKTGTRETRIYRDKIETKIQMIVNVKDTW